jgi:glycosyltransferase involved in cell wall biosynthesis
MKILQICPPWISIPPQNYGGTEWVIHNLTEELLRQGHEVTLFATGNTRSSAKVKYVFDQGLFEQNDTEWSLMQPALALPALLHYDQAFKEAEQGDYDVVHAHLSAGTDIMKLKFLADCTRPALATAHMVFPFDKWSNQDEKFIQYYGNQINIAGISHAQAALYPTNFNLLGVVHNGLDLSQMNFIAQPAGWDGQPYLTWLGKIMPWKGLDVAIQLALKTSQKLIFAGILDHHNHPESKIYFEQKVKPFIDDDQIVYLGPADLGLKNKLLGNATAFLNPISWDEPFGMVCTESMATGTPVISFNRGGAAETVKDGQTGFLVNTFDQMVEAVNNISQISRLDCRARVVDHFSATSMTKQYLQIYNRLLSTSRSIPIKHHSDVAIQ